MPKDKCYCGRDRLNRSKHCYLHSDSTKSKTCYIYFILAQGTGLVRIGNTRDLKQTLSGMCKESPAPLLCLTSFRARPWVVNALSELLSQYHDHGDWYELSDEVTTIIATATERKFEGIKEILIQRNIYNEGLT